MKKLIFKLKMPISILSSYGFNIFDITGDYIRRASHTSSHFGYHY